MTDPIKQQHVATESAEKRPVISAEQRRMLENRRRIDPRTADIGVEAAADPQRRPNLKRRAESPIARSRRERLHAMLSQNEAELRFRSYGEWRIRGRETICRRAALLAGIDVQALIERELVKRGVEV